MKSVQYSKCDEGEIVLTGTGGRTDGRTGRFAGKAAMVAGAGSGMGAAAARQLAAEGARAVVLVDLNGDGVEAVAKELPVARAVALDVGDAAQVDGAVQDVLRRHGRLDVLVYAAGGRRPRGQGACRGRPGRGVTGRATGSLDNAAWRRVMRANLDGTFHVLRAAVRAMRPFEAGAIVVIGSSSAFDMPVGYPHYAASEAAVHALSQAVAKEVIASGVRVNVVAPGRRRRGWPRARPSTTAVSGARPTPSFTA